VRLVVIGLGSPHGDDAIGLAVARRLAGETLPPGVVVVARERPLDLLDDLADADGAVLVDALAGEMPGRVRSLGPDALAPARGLSCHALGVAETLALAASLGRRLPALRVVGIGAGSGRGESLSPCVAEAQGAACAAVRRALSELSDLRSPPARCASRRSAGLLASAPHRDGE
jgi:hydrogenase maturation protease